MPFKFTKLEIPEVLIIEPTVLKDERGFFMEGFKYSEFQKNGISFNILQENLSHSKKNVLRGLHYQLKEAAQGKLICAVWGSLFDVAIDLRIGSPSYGKWVGVTLSRENRKMIWIPPGFAHGFLALEDDTEILYKTTGEYSQEKERGIIWNDPTIGIKWPFKNPLLSKRDRNLPTLDKAENDFHWEKN